MKFRRGAVESTAILAILTTFGATIAIFIEPYWSAIVGSMGYLWYQNEHNGVRITLKNILTIVFFGFIVGWITHTGLIDADMKDNYKKIVVALAGFLSYEIIKIVGNRSESMLISLFDTASVRAKEAINKWKR